MQQGNVTFGGD